MNCSDAKALWNHKGGLIGGLMCAGHGYQEVLPYLIKLAHDFKMGVPDQFDTAVKRIVGKGPYRVTHRDDEDDLSHRIHGVIGDEAACAVVSRHIGNIVGIPTLRFANVCCSGCKVSDGILPEEMNLAIQMAAVNTAPDGSPFR